MLDRVHPVNVISAAIFTQCTRNVHDRHDVNDEVPEAPKRFICPVPYPKRLPMSQPAPYSPVPKNGTTAPSNVNKEPLPPAPPLLDDHPYIRITQSQGLPERDFDPTKRIPVPLTQAEIRTLAQHHLDSVYHFLCYMKSGGSIGSSELYRDAYYRARFGELAELLSRDDQAKFHEIMRRRNIYVETLRDPEEESP